MSEKDQAALLAARYSDAPPNVPEHDVLRAMLARGSCRAFRPEPVARETLELLCAVALAAPTKSDLQQRDIILIEDPKVRRALNDLLSSQAWTAEAPTLVVFCGNNRRQRMTHALHAIPFANDHFDAVFNATADAALALGAFVTAAEAIGLGCCPISAIRNEARAVSDVLHLPEHMFPFAGLAVGTPKHSPEIARRLPLSVTCHTDRYSETDVPDAIQRYDTTRHYAAQRFPERFGHTAAYGWSEDKARQYSAPERADFGAYIRAQGFNLD